jgi:protoheme IX farnesyltransferase
MTGKSSAEKLAAPFRAFDAPRPRWAPLVELTKARLVALVLVTTTAGYLLGGSPPIDGWRLLWTVTGTALCAGGANAANQWLEVRGDAQMERTRTRPLPTGKISLWQAFSVAVALTIAGPVLLAVTTNWLAAGLAVAAAAVYVLVYTPLKTRTSFCTLVGALCGALPPMLGWAAATGTLGAGAWILGATLFAWQIPHFLALAWLHRVDYARGGLRVLPVADPSGEATSRVAVVYTLALLPLGMAGTLAGVTGWVCGVGSFALGGALVVLSVVLCYHRSDRNARRLFVASVVYLPLLLGLMVADRGPVL